MTAPPAGVSSDRGCRCLAASVYPLGSGRGRSGPGARKPQSRPLTAPPASSSTRCSCPCWNGLGRGWMPAPCVEYCVEYHGPRRPPAVVLGEARLLREKEGAKARAGGSSAGSGPSAILTLRPCGRPGPQTRRGILPRRWSALPGDGSSPVYILARADGHHFVHGSNFPPRKARLLSRSLTPWRRPG